MKFEDLEFKPHGLAKELDKIPDEIRTPTMDSWANHKQAIFECGDLKVSIIFGEMFYSNGVDTYEIMAIAGVPSEVEDNQPLGYLTKTEVEATINDWCTNGKK